MRDFPDNKSVNVYEGPHKESPVEIQIHAILLTAGVIFLLACVLVVAASIFSERLTQAILDARQTAIDFLVAFFRR